MPAVKKPSKKAPAKPKSPKRPKRKSTRAKKSTRGAPARAARRVGNLALAGVVGAGVIGACALALLWAGGYVGLLTDGANRALERRVADAGLSVRRVTLAGRRFAALEDVEAAVGPIVGDAITHVDLDAARARVEGLGWVRAASVSRLYPDTIHVSVRERDPAAVWQIAGDLFLIDDEGAVIRDVGVYEYANLPLIVGSGAPEAAAAPLRALRRRPAIEKRVAALVRVGERRWNLRMKNGVDVKLPATDIDGAIETLDVMQDVQGALDRKPEYIDLRDPERIIARPRRSDGEAGSADDDPKPTIKKTTTP
ncbi:MAG: cell division protein FtsQ/DivIB [Pseudomonadota bacterium]